jgi:hypothetical protein
LLKKNYVYPGTTNGSDIWSQVLGVCIVALLLEDEDVLVLEARPDRVAKMNR